MCSHGGPQSFVVLVSALSALFFISTFAFVWTFFLAAPVGAVAQQISESVHKRAEVKRLDALRKKRLQAATGYSKSLLGTVDNVHLRPVLPDLPPRQYPDRRNDQGTLVRLVPPALMLVF